MIHQITRAELIVIAARLKQAQDMVGYSNERMATIGFARFFMKLHCQTPGTFLMSALDMPEIMLYIYGRSWKLQFSASSSIIIIEDYYLQTFLHSL